MTTETTTTTDTSRPVLIQTATGGVLGVRLDTFTDRDGQVGHLVELLEAGVVLATLTPAKARHLARTLDWLADLTEPLDREAFSPVLEALGITMEELAQKAGLDLSTASLADSHSLVNALVDEVLDLAPTSSGR